jgi:hypothetical protein
MKYCNKLKKKTTLPKLAHFLRSKYLSVAILMELFDGLAMRPKPLTKFSVIGDTSALSPAPWTCVTS